MKGRKNKPQNQSATQNPRKVAAFANYFITSHFTYNNETAPLIL